jgi:hypothetical protein
MRCAECGQQTAEAAPACVLCGAPVARLAPKSSVRPQEAWPARRARPSWRIVAVGLAAFAAVIVANAVANSPAQGRLSRAQLQPGDCLTGLHLSANGADPSWPAKVSSVPCNQPHSAEVFFAGDIWPRSAQYQGQSMMADQADWQCRNAFINYDGINTYNSAYSYLYSVPDSRADWASGDRFVVCVAFLSPGVPGGSTMTHSIKGSNQ